MKTQNCGVLLVSSTRDLAWCPSNSVIGLSRWADHFILAVVFQVLLPCEFWGFSMECTGFSLVSFWFSPTRSLLQLLVLLVSLLFPFCGCFHSYYSSSFCSISPLSLLFTSLFLVFPSDCLTAHTTFSLARNFPMYLTVATLFSCSRVSLLVCVSWLRNAIYLGKEEGLQKVPQPLQVLKELVKTLLSCHGLPVTQTNQNQMFWTGGPKLEQVSSTQSSA